MCVSRFPLQCRTTFALLRSAVRRGRFIPEIYFPLKRSRKRFRPLVEVRRSFSLSPRTKFYDSKFRRCSLKNEFAPATKGGEGEGDSSKGEDHFRETHDRIILLERLHEAHTLKLYEAVRAFGISFEHFSFVFLEVVDLQVQQRSMQIENSRLEDFGFQFFFFFLMIFLGKYIKLYWDEKNYEIFSLTIKRNVFLL